jgi:hypothetical protein
MAPGELIPLRYRSRLTDWVDVETELGLAGLLLNDKKPTGIAAGLRAAAGFGFAQLKSEERNIRRCCTAKQR